MNSSFLKILAIITMLLDHLAKSIFLGNEIMLILGRISFPLFAFLLVEGYVHTSNYKKYLTRIFIFALISEIPFDLFISGKIFYPVSQNIGFTLLLGLIVLRLIDYTRKNIVIGISLLFFMTPLICLSMCDYRLKGILIIVLFYLLRNCKNKQLLMFVFLFLIGFTGPVFLKNIQIPLGSFMSLSVIPLYFYNGKKGFKDKLLYLVYPIHLLILVLLKNSL